MRSVTQEGMSAGLPGGYPGEPPEPADLPVLTLDATTLRAEPGGQAQTTLTLRNPGQLVESFTLDVVGLDTDWWEVHPPELALYPGEDATAVVVLTPPAQARAPEEALPFGVRAISTLDPSRGIVEEGDLEVGRVFDLQPTITPVTSKGRWSARHTVTYTNWGNAPVRLRLQATDKDGRLGFQLTPDQLLVPMGGSATARLRVRPRDPFLRGSPVHLPFQVRGEQPGSGVPAGPRSAAARAGVPDPTQPALDAAMQQLPILTRGVIVALAALILAIGATVGLLFRAGAVAGARTSDAPPEPPTAVAAEALTASLVHVEWAAPARADGYEVVTTDSRGTGLKSDPVKGAVTAFDVEIPQAKPATQYCFQVVALRGEDLRSGASEKSCATTLTTTLKAPTDVEVSQPGPGRLRVTWKGEKKHTHAVLLDGAAASPAVPPGIFAELIDDVPAGKRCVTVIARHDEEVSPSSEEKCIPAVGDPPSAVPGDGGVAAPTITPSDRSGSTSTTSGPGGSPPATLTGWAAVLGEPLQERALADTYVKQLVARGVPAQVVTVAAFPSLYPVATTLLVVVSNFPDREAVEQFCASLPPEALKPCRPAQAGV